MKIQARQHRPAFIDTDEPRGTATATSVAELLAVPWIAQWAGDDLVIDHGVRRVRPFHQWSLSDNCLMAEYDGGDHFWVVAYLTSDEPIPLPAWKETETARLRRERWNRGETG